MREGYDTSDGLTCDDHEEQQTNMMAKGDCSACTFQMSTQSLTQLTHYTSVRRHTPIPTTEILPPEAIPIRLLAPVQRRPLRLILEQPQSLGIIPLIRGKPMIDTRRHDHKIALFKRNAHPIILLATHIEESAAIDDVANLLVLVQVLVEEGFDLLFVVGEGFGRDGDLVAVLVGAFRGDAVYVVQRAEVVVHDAEFREVVAAYFAAGVVRLALVALWCWC